MSDCFLGFIHKIFTTGDPTEPRQTEESLLVSAGWRSICRWISLSGLVVCQSREGETDEIFLVFSGRFDWEALGGRCVQAQTERQTTGGEGATSHHKPMTLTYQEPLSVKMILGAPGSLGLGQTLFH